MFHKLCIHNELDDIFKYISSTNSAILMLHLEAKLLWALQAKLPFQLFGITPIYSVKQLWLMKSHLVTEFFCKQPPKLDQEKTSTVLYCIIFQKDQSPISMVFGLVFYLNNQLIGRIMQFHIWSKITW